LKPDTQLWLEKAERAIRNAKQLLPADPDATVGHAYYAMFYCATALLNERGLHFRRHSALHAAFAREFTRSGLLDQRFHRWLIDAFDRRIRADYSLHPILGDKDAELVVGQAEELLAATHAYLDQHPS
jgi:uncharacterized protein (UPF0332 family)